MSPEIVNRTFPIDPAALEPAITAETKPFWEALDKGEFVGQACSACGAVQLPGGPVCQRCGSGDLDWIPLSGMGVIFSWIRYHRNYLPEFADLLPYEVAVIQLDEGARLYARLSGVLNPMIGDSVRLVIERWPSGRCFPIFVPA
jgi:uncharacterized OB-fold protein